MTTVRELYYWCAKNCFSIEGQDGVKYVAIDYEELKEQEKYFIDKEEEQLTQSFDEGIIVALKSKKS